MKAHLGSRSATRLLARSPLNPPPTGSRSLCKAQQVHRAQPAPLAPLVHRVKRVSLALKVFKASLVTPAPKVQQA